MGHGHGLQEDYPDGLVGFIKNEGRAPNAHIAGAFENKYFIYAVDGELHVQSRIR